jgi:hypothetical protein
MGALAAIQPTRAGAVSTAGAAVASSDTISAAILGDRGAFLEVINGGASPDVVAITDSTTTITQAAATPGGGSVTNATSRIFFIHPRQVDANGVVTVTHTFITTVTYKLYPLSY